MQDRPKEPPGLVRRRAELREAQDRAGRQMTRTPGVGIEQRDVSELRRASNALARQEAEQRRRLARDVGRKIAGPKPLADRYAADSDNKGTDQDMAMREYSERRALERDARARGRRGF